jgi:hypothetical protein
LGAHEGADLSETFADNLFLLGRGLLTLSDCRGSLRARVPGGQKSECDQSQHDEYLQ